MKITTAGGSRDRNNVVVPKLPLIVFTIILNHNIPDVSIIMSIAIVL